MPLTDTFVRTVKPKATTQRYTDEKALYLEVSPAGGKLWRMKYRYADREKRMSFGQYPDVGLRDARERRDEARKLLAQGIDPGEKKKEQKRERIARAGNTFEATAREFLTKRTKWAKSHKDRVERMPSEPSTDTTVQRQSGVLFVSRHWYLFGRVSCATPSGRSST